MTPLRTLLMLLGVSQDCVARQTFSNKHALAQEIMEDPVVAADGETYDRVCIQQWFDLGKRSSPMTNMPLSSTTLVPNLRIRSAIQEWGQQHTLP